MTAMTAQTSRVGVADRMVPDRMVAESEWQRAWFSLQRREWSSLAIIGTESGAEAETAARNLATIGTRDGLRSVRVLSAHDLTFADAPRIAEYLAEAAAAGDLVLVPCDPLRTNHAVMSVLHAVSGVILVAQLGVSQASWVKKTIEAVGRERVFATISVG